MGEPRIGVVCVWGTKGKFYFSKNFTRIMLAPEAMDGEAVVSWNASASGGSHKNGPCGDRVRDGRSAGSAPRRRKSPADLAAPRLFPSPKTRRKVMFDKAGKLDLKQPVGPRLVTRQIRDHAQGIHLILAHDPVFWTSTRHPLRLGLPKAMARVPAYSLPKRHSCLLQVSTMPDTRGSDREKGCDSWRLLSSSRPRLSFRPRSSRSLTMK